MINAYIPKHEIKKCLCCGSEFECKVGTITECQCFQVQLSEEESAYIRSKGFEDCLCANCMLVLKGEIRFKVDM